MKMPARSVLLVVAAAAAQASALLELPNLAAFAVHAA